MSHHASGSKGVCPERPALARRRPQPRGCAEKLTAAAEQQAVGASREPYAPAILTSTGSESAGLGLSRLCRLLAVCPWESPLTFLSLSIPFICPWISPNKVPAGAGEDAYRGHPARLPRQRSGNGAR